MNKKELEKYKELLLKKREEISEQIDSRRTDRSTTSKEASGDLSSYSYHMADQGSDANEREKDFMYSSKGSRLIYHIDQALRRIENGEYGKCQNCGGEIKKARLEAVPHARLCIECKENEEIQSGRR